jgi:hypothetical protein
MSERTNGDRRLGLKQWATLLDIPFGSIKFARRHGQFPTGSLPEGLGVAAARAARTRGASLEQAGNLLGYLSGLSVDALERRFAAGCTHVLMMGEKVLCRLVPPEAVIQNKTVQDNLPAAWAAGLTPTLIDVGAIWRRIKEEVAKLDSVGKEAEARAAAR